ncbi:MAG TPA: EAL domain-containing protein [Pyrinomonadaceae bacterium]|nr:EAL domain-containing protein [Pyrinomonadaceae bacterium]
MSLGDQDSGLAVNFAEALRLAADLCGVPMAMVTSHENGNIRLECEYGLSRFTATGFCQHAVLQDDLLEVIDATLDARFRDLPEVRGAPFIRFYAGASLVSPTGQRLGTLALLDSQPRTIDDVQRAHIRTVAHQVMVHLEFRRQHTQLKQLAAELERVNRRLHEQADHLKQAQHIARVGSWKYQVAENHLSLSDEILYMYGLTPAEFGGTMEAFIDLVHPEDRQSVRSAKETAMQFGNASVQCRVMRKDGKIRYFETIGQLFCEKNGQEYLAGTTQDITEQKVAEHRIGQLAYVDQLTGLPNRKFVLDRIDRLVAMHHRTPQDAAVLFIDLDNFKALNDTHGHDKGDMLLKQVAQRLQTCVRHYDCVGRFGGDEFVVLLEHLGTGSINEATHACQVAQKILLVLNEPYVLETLQHRITPSIGIAIFDHEMVSTSDFLRRADMAMYKAKAEGRNTIRFFSAEMQDAVNARSQLEADLRQALTAQEFYLAYQPQVDRRGRIVGVEVLLRWQHPTRGLVMPAEFIALAEELGLIAEIGNWLLEQACQQLVQWTKDPPTQHLTLSVNVSVRQFRHPAFIDQTIEILSRTGADPGKLKIEITESMLISDIEETRRKMIALKAIGVRFALDDFGTGFSSLAYLQKLPLDELKIDQSFIQNVTTDQNNAAITRSIIALGHNLGLSVIAEGVETEDQRQFLADEGCANFQGYLYHEPLAAPTIKSFLRDDGHPQ